MNPAQASAGHPSAATCRTEVAELHAFFQDWFRGELPRTRSAFAAFADALGADFEIVSPDGHSSVREELLEALWELHGRESAAGLRIRVADVEPHAVAPGIWRCGYEEWHQRGGTARGRRSTALLEEAPDAPRGWLWLHVHETWLPETEDVSR